VVHVVKRVLRPIYVIGLVRKPGEFPYPTSQEIRVLDALALAGGVSNPVAEDVVVIRKLPGAKEAAHIAISIQAAKSGSDNLPLAPGDTVTVEQTPLTAAVDVIQTFVRFSVGANPSWF
jgi:polysaccharide export outer membrane protein